MPYYRRNIIILATTIFLASVSWTQVIPFLPLFVKELGIDGKDLLLWTGILFSAQSMASIVAQPFWGKMGDKYGRKPMAVRAGLGLVIIYFGMSFVTNIWQLLTIRILNGMLTGFIPGSMALIATNTPKEMAPRYIATAQTSSASGQIVGPLIGGLLAAGFGYRGSMRVSGAAVLLCTLFVIWLVREPNKAEVAESTSLFEDFTASFRSPVLASIMFTVMLYGLTISSINPFLTLHVAKIAPGSPGWLAGFIYSLPPIALVLTAHLWTHLGKRHGYNMPIVVGLAGAALCIFTLAVARNIWVFSIALFSTGVFLAALNPSTAALIIVRVREGFRGRAYGMQTSASTLGCFVAPILAGSVAASFGISAIFVLLGCVLLAGTLLFPSFARAWDSEKGMADPVTINPKYNAD
jgi:DHA1 family multidrug resistance protein-like MFS transporter